jgi:hypothetical protein
MADVLDVRRLRCSDHERDPRANRDGHLEIASCRCVVCVSFALQPAGKPSGRAVNRIVIGRRCARPGSSTTVARLYAWSPVTRREKGPGTLRL